MKKWKKWTKILYNLDYTLQEVQNSRQAITKNVVGVPIIFKAIFCTMYRIFCVRLEYKLNWLR